MFVCITYALRYHFKMNSFFLLTDMNLTLEEKTQNTI